MTTSSDSSTDERSIGAATAAGVGARVGVLFAACEAVAASWLARASLDGIDYIPQSALSFLLSLVAHAVLGAAAGALAAPWTPALARRTARPARELVARAATLAVLLAVLAQQASLLPNGALEIRQSIALTAGLSVLILASLAARAPGAWLAGVASPWTGAVAVALVPWVADHPLQDASWTVRQTGGLLTALACGAAATLARSSLASRRALGTPVVGAAALVGIAGALVEQAVLDSPAQPGGPVAGRNVILITLDTVRADHLSLYGYPRDTTPFLRELAREAVVFERSFSAGDYTLSTHASLFTGQYPIEHGAHPFTDRALSGSLQREVLTLGERLVERGWQTSAVASNFTLHPRFGVAQGFENYDIRFRRTAFPRTPMWTLRARLHAWLERVLPPHEFDMTHRNATQITRAGIERIERRDRDRPFFLFLNYLDAHSPYRPPPPFDTLFAPSRGPMDKDVHRAYRMDVFRGKTTLPDAAREEYVALYDGGIAYADSEVRTLVDHLKQAGLYDDTLIIVTSDHGEAFGEHASVEHGISVYQELVKVPLLVKRPGAREGLRTDAPANSVDILPTVLAELGLEVPADLPGHALFAPEPQPDRVVFSEHYPTDWQFENNASRAIHKTAAAWRNFVQIRRDDGHTEIYDLAADPRQERPLDALPPGAPDLGAMLELWIPPKRTGGEAERKRTIDALKMLGYGK